MLPSSPIFIQSVQPYWHTISICGAIVSSVVGSLWTLMCRLDKYATNHFEHMKMDIVAAIEKSGDKVVIAILQGARPRTEGKN